MKAGVTVWRYLIFFLQRILWLFWGLCFLETICKSFFLSLWSPTIFFPFSRCLFFFSFWEVTSCAEFSLVGCLASRQIDVFYNVRENFSFFIVFVRIIGFHLISFRSCIGRVCTVLQVNTVMSQLGLYHASLVSIPQLSCTISICNRQVDLVHMVKY